MGGLSSTPGPPTWPGAPPSCHDSHRCPQTSPSIPRRQNRPRVRDPGLEELRPCEQLPFVDSRHVHSASTGRLIRGLPHPGCTALSSPVTLSDPCLSQGCAAGAPGRVCCWRHLHWSHDGQRDKWTDGVEKRQGFAGSSAKAHVSNELAPFSQSLFPLKHLHLQPGNKGKLGQEVGGNGCQRTGALPPRGQGCWKQLSLFGIPGVALVLPFSSLQVEPTP